MPTLQEFIDDELLRAPMAIDQLVDAVLQEWRAQMPAAALRGASDPSRTLQTHRSDLVQSALRQLRLQAQAPLAELEAASPPPAASLELSLVDEDEVAVDIEVSRCIEAVRSLAEQELRDMQAYASALAGDLNVSRDLNPFRPEGWVRSIWLAVQTLPLTRGIQAAFLRDAALPLARVLKRGYSAACSRLHEAGVTPAVHRTIKLHGGIRIADASMPDPGALHDLRDSMPMPLDMPGPSAHTMSPPSTMSAPSGSSGKVDPQLIELLSRLFDAIQADRHIDGQTLPLLLRLHPTALRCALRDPAMLDTYDHPVWRFMDRLSFLLDTCPRTETERALPFARSLVDDVVSAADGSADRFIWSLERITAFERHLLDRNLAEAAPQIDHFQRRDLADAGNTTGSAPPLDIATLDTIPSGLLQAEHELTPGNLHDLRVGMFLKAYLQGDWRTLQLLWRAQHGDVWLLLDPHSGRRHALRRRALVRLEGEGLAAPLSPRSLVRAAAARVLRTIGTAR